MASSSNHGMATAISIDMGDIPASCRCEEDSQLAVQFISTKRTDGIAVSALHQEIFFDYVSLLATNRDVCFVLDERFDSFLDEGDREFKATIQDMMEQANQTVRETLAFQRLNEFLQQNMGLNNLGKKTRYRMEGIQRQEDPDSGLGLSGKTTAQSNSTHALPGHVFCINGSVCDLACDAFLCPCSIPRNESKHTLAGKIFSRWRGRQSRHYLEFWSILQDKSAAGDKLHLKRYAQSPNVATLRDWPWAAFADGKLPAPLPLFVAANVQVGYCKSNAPSAADHVGRLICTLRAGIDVALMELDEHQPKPQHGRYRYLLAVPVLGTGFGGAADLTGQVVDEMLKTLNYYASEKKNVDFVLVCADTATYAHAQQKRYRQWRESPSFKAVMNESLHRESGRLAKLSSDKQLSLFLGAGISVGSGLPTWFQLLNQLEDEFTLHGTAAERTLGLLHNWDPLVMAQALEDLAMARPDRHGRTIRLKQRVRTIIHERSRNPGLLLYLLLCLEPTSIVTQNYDQLIERACACRSLADVSRQNKESLSVIPYDPRRGSPRWLLKMHGCVSSTKDSDVVFTASDYKFFEAGRLRALEGLVQANLMTSHFLFCGFSMTDPNYLRILDEVRHALKPGFVKEKVE